MKCKSDLEENHSGKLWKVHFQWNTQTLTLILSFQIFYQILGADNRHVL